MSASEPRPYLASLAGIRFFAALHVALYHLAQFSYAFSQNTAPRHHQQARWAGEIWGIFADSWIVRGITKGALVELSMFFIMSGFILTYAHPVSANGSFDKRNYFRHRLSRLLPMYFFALFVTLPIFLAFCGQPNSPLTPTMILAAAIVVPLLLQAWSPTLALTPWNPPAWSLSVEAFAYCVFPMAAIRTSRWGTRRLVAFALGCWVVVLLAPIVYMATNPDGFPLDAFGLAAVTWTSEGYWLNFVRYNPLLRLPEFLLGVALGQIFSERAAQNYLSKRKQGGWVTFASIAGVLAVLAFTEHIPYLLLHNGLLGPLFAAAIVSLALGGGWIGWICSRKPIVLLGESAYGLYMLHFPVLAYTMWGIGEDLRKVNKPPPDPMVYLLFYVAISVGLSVVVHLLVERPGRRLVSWLLGGRRTRRMDTIAFISAEPVIVDGRLPLAQTTMPDSAITATVVQPFVVKPPIAVTVSHSSLRESPDTP